MDNVQRMFVAEIAMRRALQFNNEFRFVVALAIGRHKGKSIGVRPNGK
jgi:hypothetical protein